MNLRTLAPLSLALLALACPGDEPNERVDASDTNPTGDTNPTTTATTNPTTTADGSDTTQGMADTTMGSSATMATTENTRSQRMSRTR